MKEGSCSFSSVLPLFKGTPLNWVERREFLPNDTMKMPYALVLSPLLGALWCNTAHPECWKNTQSHDISSLLFHRQTGK